MRRLVLVIGILAMLLAGCGVKLPDHIDLPTQLTGNDPKTLVLTVSRGDDHGVLCRR